MVGVSRATVAAAILTSGCLASPGARPQLQTEVGLDVVVDAPSSPDVPDMPPFVPDAPDVSHDGPTDASETPDTFFPLPAVGSGETAWWRMEWIQPLGGETCVGPIVDGYRSFAIVVRDDPVIPETLSLTFMRDEACMYWGGSGNHEFQYHFRSAKADPLGEFVSAVGATTREVTLRPFDIGRNGTSSHRFARTGGDTTALVLAVVSQGRWLEGLPFLVQHTVVGDFAFGANEPPFNELAPAFDVVAYPTLADREKQTNGVFQPAILRTSTRLTSIDGFETLYVLESLELGGNLSCDERWFQRGIGPYFHIANEIPQGGAYPACRSAAAVDDEEALADPMTHAERSSTAPGWGVRRDYCHGPTCFVAPGE